VSPREQALRKRVAYLEARSNALMMVLDRAIDDIERAESVACAFAWDLQFKILNRENFDLDEITLHEIEWHMREAGK
jgi:hypothetical protein